MDKLTTLKLAVLSIVLASGLWPGPTIASSAKGWEEQAWRAGFLAQHSRFLMVADLEDEDGNRARVMSMRGFANTPIDGVFIAPLNEDGKAGEGWFRGYVQSANGGRVIVDEQVREVSNDTFSSQQWWIDQAPATSFAQWWAMALAVPQQPRSGGCRFSSHDHVGGKQKVWLPRTCTMEDPVTGRPIKLDWSGWRTASKEPEGWQLWVPARTQVSVEGKHYTIELRNLQMRTAHGSEPDWPLSIVPQAFPELSKQSPGMEEVPVPIEDLDYHEWKAD